MYKSIVLIICLFLIEQVSLEIIWENYQNVTINMCPNPADPNFLLSKDPLVFKTQLPHEFSNGPYEKWCRKLGCENGYQMSSYTIRTPYIHSLVGFRAQVEWFYNKANYTRNDTKLINSKWCIYYNQNHCYSGGTEFGFCHRVNQYNRIEFYATCPFENYYDIPEHLRIKAKFQIPLRPVQGMNFVNLSAISTDDGYDITVSYYNDLIPLNVSTHHVPYPPCYLDTRDSVGRLTASMDPNFNMYTRDKINYKVLEYAYDTERFPAPIGPPVPVILLPENLIGK